LFREAQVFFNLYGRLMPVLTDAPAGVMHWTYPVPLRLVGWRNVYTIHDAIPLTHPALTPIDPRRHRRLLIRVAAEADRLLTVSMAARSEILEALVCPAAQVTCVPQGVNPPSLGGALPAGLAPKGFFLFCGAIEPRKNLTRLVDAHAASGSLRPLVIAGPAGWRSSEILQQIESRANVIRLPYQDRGALDALIRGARALLFPSLAEGFGIPIVEAMMAATAVMTTSRGAPAEIAGGAALGVDPEDSDAMSLAIGELDQDDALVARLSAAGLKRAEAFALPAYASRLMDFYASLVGRQA
jgi:glycosyltransferase involved in cell wall biosynthesis